MHGKVVVAMDLLRTRRLAGIAALSAVWLALWCAPALAHARLLEAEPSSGVALENVPEQVRLRFSEPVDVELSPLEVYDSDGDRVDRDDARVDPDDARVVEADLKDGLPGGSYKVKWRVTSIDGHVVAGAYDFSVVSNAGEPESGAKVEGAEEPEARSAGQQEPADPIGREEAGGGFGQTLVYSALSLGALGLVVLVVLGMTRLRRRKP